ncbi:hypothetical protein Tsp_07387 [Trichinella spiralis]|uniref:Uncharacterized protein n=1 Tax=Trichinella spiralis TaxID=6334 RepID=E5RYZ0_TRISP|nr:hypothetical protein Tsp_07387 [Trichinella spiralis]KRY32777.1 hypothetical protein T01_5460 [Trichinella spiralis]
MERLTYLASSPVTVSLASMAKVLDTEDSSFCEIQGILSTHSVKALSDDLDAGLETRSTINYDNTVNASQEVVGTLIEVHKEDDSELNICSFRGLERTCHLLVLEMPYFYAPVFRITNEMTVLEDGIRISDLWMSSIIYYTNIHVTTVFRMKRIRKTSQPKEFETHKHLSIRSSLENAACSLSCFATAPLSQKKFLYQLFLQGCRFISYPLSNLLHFHTLRAVFVPLLNWEH